MFDVCIIIHGVFETPADVHDPHDPEEVLDIAHVLKKPSTFRNVDWEIVDKNTGEFLVSWDSDSKIETISQVIWDALRSEETYESDNAD